MNMPFHIAGILIGFIGSAFFSGLEIGVLSVNRARLVHYVREDGIQAAMRLEHYLQHAHQFLGSILVGNNLFNVLLSTLSAALGKAMFEGRSSLQSSWAVFMAVMVLVFCEYIPKLVFESRPLRRTLPLVQVFHAFDIVLRPITLLVLFITQWMMPRKCRPGDSQLLITRELLHDMVTDRESGAHINPVERIMIKRVLALQSFTAAEIMTPLDHVSKVSEKHHLKKCYDVIRDSGHVRLPVFSADGKRCVGVLHGLDVLSFMPDPATTLAAAYMQPPFFVPYDIRADDLLPLMRRNKQPMAFVRNREAEVIGIVTEANILGRLTVNLAAS